MSVPLSAAPSTYGSTSSRVDSTAAQAPRSTARRVDAAAAGGERLLLAAGALTSKGSARDSPAALTWAARAHVRRHEQQQQRLLDGIQRRQLDTLRKGDLRQHRVVAVLLHADYARPELQDRHEAAHVAYTRRLPLSLLVARAMLSRVARFESVCWLTLSARLLDDRAGRAAAAPTHAAQTKASP